MISTPNRATNNLRQKQRSMKRSCFDCRLSCHLICQRTRLMTLHNALDICEFMDQESAKSTATGEELTKFEYDN